MLLFAMALATRLLSLLTLIENVMKNEGAPGLGDVVERAVNFHKGLARMGFPGKGTVALQSYTLADGQICVKAVLSWSGCSETATTSIYPHDSFDWFAAAQKIAQIWIAGPAAGRGPGQAGENSAAGQSLETSLAASA
jgi:hypothetical protein